MLVTAKNFDAACKLIEKENAVGFDTETFTLFWWRSKWLREAGLEPGVFAMQFATEERDFYFDFLHSPDRLGDKHFALINERITQDPNKLWYIHNAKFDLHQSKNHDVDFAGTVHCTQAGARVLNNVEPIVSLDELSSRYFDEKKVDIKPLFKAEGMVTKVPAPWRSGEMYEQLRFDKLPLDTSYVYGCKDVRLCRKLGVMQVEKILEFSKEFDAKGIKSAWGRMPFDVMLTERKLTKALFRMERRGVKLDLDYVNAAMKFDIEKSDAVRTELDAIARAYLAPDVSIDWQSPKQLKPLFDAAGEPYSYTEKGNASFDKEALEDSKSPLAQNILKYRFHAKRCSTYWENFLWLCDEDGVLHADFVQGGPETGRMSCRSPNLQNLPKRRDKDQVEFRVRKAFVPRPGFVFADWDWDQMEYRMMLCYSNEKSLIDKINNEGLDVHEAVNTEMEIGDREAAKSVNFLNLYGGGVAKLAQALYPVKLPLQTLKDIFHLMRWKDWTEADIISGIGQTFELGKGKWQKKFHLKFTREDFEHDLPLLRKANQLQELYFKKLPETSDWMQRVKAVAKDRGFILNWAGRLMRYDSNTDYKSPNGIIQGGCGDASKEAVVEADEHFQGSQSGLCAQVHDELLAEIHTTELHLAPRVVEIMENIFPSELLKLTAGVAWSHRSWGDLTDTLEGTN